MTEIPFDRRAYYEALARHEEAYQCHVPLNAEHDTIRREARAEALEDAAQVARKWMDDLDILTGLGLDEEPDRIAAAIRALKDKP